MLIVVISKYTTFINTLFSIKIIINKKKTIQSYIEKTISYIKKQPILIEKQKKISIMEKYISSQMDFTPATKEELIIAESKEQFTYLLDELSFKYEYPTVNYIEDDCFNFLYWYILSDDIGIDILINLITKKAKKYLAYKHLNKAFTLIKKWTGLAPIYLLKNSIYTEAINNNITTRTITLRNVIWTNPMIPSSRSYITKAVRKVLSYAFLNSDEYKKKYKKKIPFFVRIASSILYNCFYDTGFDYKDRLMGDFIISNMKKVEQKMINTHISDIEYNIDKQRIYDPEEPNEYNFFKRIRKIFPSEKSNDFYINAQHERGLFKIKSKSRTNLERRQIRTLKRIAFLKNDGSKYFDYSINFRKFKFLASKLNIQTKAHIKTKWFSY